MYDSKTVFYKTYKLNKANPKSWKKIKENYYYSNDKNIIYYFNRIIKDADAETFEIIEKIEELFEPPQLAKDKNNYYRNDSIITKEKFEEYLNE
jgi:Txe/YoeB family toxin of Txe-Axe toxin-antitoxin module